MSEQTTPQISNRRRRKQQQEDAATTTPSSPQHTPVDTPSSPINASNIPTQVEQKDIKKLCEELQNNNPLITTVDLSHQILSVNDIALLLDALTKNHYVVTVDMTACGIIDQAAEFIGEFIGMNHKSIRHLYLDLNPFSDENAILSILDGLQENHQIVDMTLNESLLPQEHLDEMDRYLLRNDDSNTTL